MRYQTIPAILATLLAAAILSSAGCSKDPAPKSTTAADAGATDPDTTDSDVAGSDTAGTDAAGSGAKNSLTLSDPNVRGCEILLTEGSATIDSVSFDGTVVGTFIRQAPKVSISVVAAKDAPMAAGAIVVSVTGDAAQVNVKKVSCVDAKAAAVPGVTATLN